MSVPEARSPLVVDSRPLASGPPSAEANVVEVEYRSHAQLLDALLGQRSEAVLVQVEDGVNMIAGLRGVDRAEILRIAVSSWFHHAVGHPVIEAECHEQAPSNDSSVGFLLFRVRLDADHQQEVQSLDPDEDLPKKYRRCLIDALPGDIATKADSSSLAQMVQISWTKEGSIELGGVAALSLVVLIVMTIGIGVRSCGDWLDFFCPCVAREGRESGALLRELWERGTSIEVDPDGKARLTVKPAPVPRWRCIVL